MCRVSTFVSFVYILFVITSNISNATDNNFNNTSNVTTIQSLKSTFGTELLHNSTIKNNDTQHKLENDQHMLMNEEPIITEGGLIKPSSSSISTLVNNESKKTFAKIVPRKGANSPYNNTNSLTENVAVVSRLTTAGTLLQHNTMESISEIKIKTINNNATMNASTTEATSKQTVEIKVQEKQVKETTEMSVSTTSKKHKPKPTVTIGQSEEDKPIPSSSTRKQRRIDYIVPVVITVIILPILIITLYIMYRRGRDCWDKRHYRRMDFLIDGMYNE